MHEQYYHMIRSETAVHLVSIGGSSTIDFWQQHRGKPVGNRGAAHKPSTNVSFVLMCVLHDCERIIRKLLLHVPALSAGLPTAIGCLSRCMATATATPTATAERHHQSSSSSSINSNAKSIYCKWSSPTRSSLSPMMVAHGCVRTPTTPTRPPAGHVCTVVCGGPPASPPAALPATPLPMARPALLAGTGR
jgi:hypothetical protein